MNHVQGPSRDSRAYPGTPQRSGKEIMPKTRPEKRLQHLTSKENAIPEGGLLKEADL